VCKIKVERNKIKVVKYTNKKRIREDKSNTNEVVDSFMKRKGVQLKMYQGVAFF